MGHTGFVGSSPRMSANTKTKSYTTDSSPSLCGIDSISNINPQKYRQIFPPQSLYEKLDQLLHQIKDMMAMVPPSVSDSSSIQIESKNYKDRDKNRIVDMPSVKGPKLKAPILKHDRKNKKLHAHVVGKTKADVDLCSGEKGEEKKEEEEEGDIDPA